MKKLFICLCIVLSMPFNCVSVFAQEVADTTPVSEVEDPSNEEIPETETVEQEDLENPDSLDEEETTEEDNEVEKDEEVSETEEQDASTDQPSEEQVDNTSIEYQTHVQNIGWQSWKKNGDISGTSGQSLRLEAIRIQLKDSLYAGGIQYRSHIQNIGWEASWAGNGGASGTSGQALRLEAIQIQLTDEISQYYDVYYRVHVQNAGWLDWAKNGEMAGSAGYSYRLEAIQIQLVKKGDAAPGSVNKPFISTSGLKNINYVSYQTHIQNIGWQELKYDGKASGTTGQSKRLEGIIIQKESGLDGIEGDIQYKTHVQNIGWTSWQSSTQMSGTTGRSLRLEAIQIQLTEDLASQYDIYYRVHAQNIGWMDWAMNGAKAGTEGCSYRLEAIQIKMVLKGQKAPGNTSVPFKNYKMIQQELKGAQLARYNAVADTILAQSGNNLQAAYLWIVNNMSRFLYFPGTGNIHMSPFNYLTSEQSYAVYGIENRQGNCYVYAAMFAACARKLGYECTYVEGRVRLANGNLNSGHGWTEIKINGTTYVCDPEGQQETGRNLYMTTYSTSPVHYVK